MIKNIIRLALRTSRKDLKYSTINIFGLTVGITCSLMLLLYILDELSFDQHHKNGKNIYRIAVHVKDADREFSWTFVQGLWAKELKDNYTEVVNATRFYGASDALYEYGNERIYQRNFNYADSSFFEMFTHTFIYGNPSTALDEPASIVLTKAIATKYFGDTNALGKTLTNEKGEVFNVTGVIEDVPRTSSMQFEGIISLTGVSDEGYEWRYCNVPNYIQLKEGYEQAAMEAIINKISDEKINPYYVPFKIRMDFHLQRLSEIHLYVDENGDMNDNGPIRYLYIFGAVSILVLVIASINYMNLATARSASRAREVGIRKVMGSLRYQLIAQFLVESVILTLTALLASIVAIYMLLPLLNTLLKREFQFSYIFQPPVLLSLVGIVVLVGIVAGSYPAFYLSAFNPVRVLKGKILTHGRGAVLRKSLVVLQFCISIFLLISTLVVHHQLSYMHHRDLGFSHDRVVRINVSPELRRKTATVVEEMQRTQGVESAGSTGTVVGNGNLKYLVQIEQENGEHADRGILYFRANASYIKTMGMTIVAGRDFSVDVPSDSIEGMIVNEALVKQMGWKDPIGKRIEEPETTPGREKWKVIGVVKDYHQSSMYHPIEPLGIVYGRKSANIMVRLEPQADLTTAIANLKKTWEVICPDYPFEYSFLDEELGQLYEADALRGTIFSIFAVLAIVIACLGLSGLAAFSTEQRFKEIGIRKVIGASATGLMLLISKEFFLLVSIGTLIAFPLAWYSTSLWLETFAYRIPMVGEWITFVLCGLIALATSAITVGYYVFRAAHTNPVDVLKAE